MHVRIHAFFDLHDCVVDVCFVCLEERLEVDSVDVGRATRLWQSEIEKEECFEGVVERYPRRKCMSV